MPIKNPVSWRLSPEAKKLIFKISKKLSISKTAVVELAIRSMAHEVLQTKPEISDAGISIPT